ncbi:MAG: SatD family protein [Pseudomonadota bacterium]
MGDIVASRAAASTASLHKDFNGVVAIMNERYQSSLVSPLTITLGDEFQGLVQELGDAFEIVLDMRLLLLARGVSCRFVIGEADIETPINADRAWNMMGPGLAETRERLTEAEDNAYRFTIISNPTINRLLNTLGSVLTGYEEEWTDRQQEIMTAYLGHPEKTVSGIAEKYEVTERNVYNILRAANVNKVVKIRDAIAETLNELDQSDGRANT